jgi:hypothetical protein
MLHAGQGLGCGTSRDDKNDSDAAESLIDPDSMCQWFVRPQLFFLCTLRPICASVGGYNRCKEGIQLDLVFFRPLLVNFKFEELQACQ